MTLPFWKTKTLSEMTDEEWEALCDGCARCCLHKLEDEATGLVHYTRAACRMLDIANCRCKAYACRTRLVSDCVKLDANCAATARWLPSTCAYRCIAEGRPLPAWHPLISGNAASVHEAGISVRDFAVPEGEADDLEDHLLDEPL